MPKPIQPWQEKALKMASANRAPLACQSITIEGISALYLQTYLIQPIYYDLTSI